MHSVITSPIQLEEDKRATTTVQNGFWFFSCYSLKKALILRETLGEKLLKKCGKVSKV